MRAYWIASLCVGLIVATAATALAQPRGRRGGSDSGPEPPLTEAPPFEGTSPPSSPLIQALDADRDGTLSPEEISKAADALKLLDKNSDGKLDAAEIRPEAGPALGFPVGPPAGPQGPGGPDGFRGGPERSGPPDADGPRGRRGGRGGEGGRFGRGGPRGGRGAAGGGPLGTGGSAVLPPGAREMLQLTPQQNEQVDELEAATRSALLEILTPDQTRQLSEMRGGQPFGQGGRRGAGGGLGGRGLPGGRGGRGPRGGPPGVE